MSSWPDDGLVPAGPPPPGETPNFIDPESIGYRLTIVAVVFAVVTGIFVTLRLFTAAFILRRWHVDDCKLDLGRVCSIRFLSSISANS